MRDGLEPDERPGRERHDGEDLESGRLTVGESRSEAGESALMLHEDNRHADGDAGAEDEREDRLEPRREPLAVEEHAADKEKRNDREQDFAGIDVIAGDLVFEAEAEESAKEIPSDQRKRGGVGPGDGDVGEDQEPAADVAVVAAADALYVAVRAAGLGKVLYEIVVVAAYEEHDKRAHANAD